MNAIAIMKELKKLGSPAKAKTSARFFKTEKGQYGYGDIFIGVTVPEERIVAKKFSALPRSEIKKLLVHKIHEYRLTALMILVLQYEKGDTKTKASITAFYLAHTAYINNWDLVDASAPYILGRALLTKKRAILVRLGKSSNMWERRIAMVATYALIKEGQYQDTLDLALLLINDTHDLIHKASGWMLREVGKQSPETLHTFLQSYGSKLPRTTLRYAIERFPETVRKKYLKMK